MASLSCTIALALGLVGVIPAQQNSRVFHLYVDPIQGDDNLARTQNPSASGTFRPLQSHPGDPRTITGELQHAPYSFRTVTAAVAWINSLTIASNPPLPWTNPSNGQSIRHVVIHCMPGLYGPRSANAPPGDDDFDPASGLPWNDEQFPIEMPGHVSIQGTSALDTIFDARNYDPGVGGGTNLFVFTAPPAPVEAPDFDQSFIDSVALRGCRFVENSIAFPGAAVVIRGSTSIKPSISNCFVYGNDVGILIKNGPSGPTMVPLRPRIVANTIAWNQVGIISTDSPLVGVGLARPVVLDNLIDPIRPTSGVPAYLRGIGTGTTQPPSCFEGLDATDLRARTLGPTCLVGGNFNGYHDGLRNLRAAWPFGVTSPRTTNPLPPPVVDLAALLGPWPSVSRADLFVADTMRFLWSGRISPHDLRLTPMVQDWTRPSVWRPNPLVNQGISLRAGPVSMLNGSELVMPYEPGAANDDQARFTAWDWDCEGFGNPREASRTWRVCDATELHFPEPWQCAGKVDLGADEMGELIVTGYLDSTRTFSTAHPGIAPNTAGLAPAIDLFYLNVVCDPVLDGSYIGPQFNFRTDSAAFVPPGSQGSPEWYAQLGPWHNPFTTRLPPYAFTGGMYRVPSGPGDLVTARAVLTSGASLPPGASPYPEFMRTRVCDIGPHLADDIRPDALPDKQAVDYAEHHFALWPGAPTGLGQDVFSTNPWCNAQVHDIAPGLDDNAFLYGDRSPAATRHLKSGTLSPPLVVANDPQRANWAKSYLFRNAAHPILSWEHPSPMYQLAPNGLGVSNSNPVPFQPGMDWYGVRVNMELYLPDSPLWVPLGSPVDNVQTFLVVNGASVAGAPRNRDGSPQQVGAGKQAARPTDDGGRSRERSGKSP